MSIDDLLNLVTQGGLLVVAFLTLLEFLRHRDRQRLDITLMFGALASIVLIQDISQFTGQAAPWLGLVSAAVLFAQPYLLLRLVQHFRHVPQLLDRLALGGMLISWFVIFFGGSPIPAALSLPVILYFAGVEGYAALAFVRGALTTGGVTRNRLRLAATASGLLALLILLAGINVIAPSTIGLSGVGKLLAPLAALSYYLGFMAPRWRRNTWQLWELQNFLSDEAGMIADDGSTPMLARLCAASQSAVGGLGAAVLLPDPDSGRLHVQIASDSRLFPDELTAHPLVTQAWNGRQARVIVAPRDLLDAFKLAGSAGSASIFAVPLISLNQPLGLLLVPTWRSPLFAADDLALLRLFAEHSAVALRNASLIAELRHGTERLENEVAERRRTEMALRRSEELFSKAFRSSHAGFTITKVSDGRFVDVNDSYLELLGYAREELVGFTTKDIGVYVDETERARVIALLESQGFARDMEIRVRTKSGEAREVIASLDRIELDGEACVLSAILDISARKQIEREMQRLNVELQRRAAELEATNRELETFSYSVSHDLRSPLRSIDGFSQALLEEHANQLDASGQDYLRRVRAATLRMAELIDALLTLSQVSRGELRRAPVDLSAIAQSIAADLQKQAPARQVEFVVPEGMGAQADPRLMRIVMENLLGNAWKYTGKRPAARIEVGTAPPVDGKAAFFVRDDGAGFDMAYAGKLFGAFQRLHTQSEFSGTGIGLATVQRIIHRHAGRIWAESAVDQGATFHFTL